MFLRMTGEGRCGLVAIPFTASRFVQIAFTLQKIHKKLSWRHRERLGESYNVFQCNVPFASLHAADIIPVQTGTFREFFLGIAPFVAKSTQRRAKSRLNGTSGHTSILEA
jgi:hypothetical protein